MASYPACDHCHFQMPSSADRCPHCGLPGIFPNVRAAELQQEVQALGARYSSSLEDAQRRTAESAVLDFERHVANSEAVISMPIEEALRLANSENHAYITYYQQQKSGAKLLQDGRWDLPRAITDNLLFLGYHEHIRFGALTTNERGLRNYGKCFVLLHSHMIGHRSSVFEMNSVRFIQAQATNVTSGHTLPYGYRSNWINRGVLSVPKLADKIEHNTPSASYPDILMRNGSSTDSDDFVEVHIYGSITVRTLKSVRVEGPLSAADQVRFVDLEEKLKKFGIPCILV